MFVYVFIIIPHFFLSSVIDGQCINFGIRSMITSVYSWLSFVLNAVIPFTMLIHMNYVIIKVVRESKKLFDGNDANTRQRIGQGMDTRQKTMKIAENQLTTMLLLVATLFLILLCPIYFRFIYLVFVKRDRSTPFDYARSTLIVQITSKLYITNSGINFFLYFLSGKKFRDDLKQTISCCGISHPSHSRRKDGQLSNGNRNQQCCGTHS